MNEMSQEEENNLSSAKVAQVMLHINLNIRHPASTGDRAIFAVTDDCLWPVN
jgi:hypothetical protein